MWGKYFGKQVIILFHDTQARQFDGGHKKYHGSIPRTITNSEMRHSGYGVRKSVKN